MAGFDLVNAMDTGRIETVAMEPLSKPPHLLPPPDFQNSSFGTDLGDAFENVITKAYFAARAKIEIDERSFADRSNGTPGAQQGPPFLYAAHSVVIGPAYWQNPPVRYLNELRHGGRSTSVILILQNSPILYSSQGLFRLRGRRSRNEPAAAELKALENPVDMQFAG
jgi:hypothetical protein